MFQRKLSVINLSSASCTLLWCWLTEKLACDEQITIMSRTSSGTRVQLLYSPRKQWKRSLTGKRKILINKAKNWKLCPYNNKNWHNIIWFPILVFFSYEKYVYMIKMFSFINQTYFNLIYLWYLHSFIISHRRKLTLHTSIYLWH